MCGAGWIARAPVSLNLHTCMCFRTGPQTGKTSVQIPREQRPQAHVSRIPSQPPPPPFYGAELRPAAYISDAQQKATLMGFERVTANHSVWLASAQL